MKKMNLCGWFIFVYPEGVIWWMVLGLCRPQLEELHQYFSQAKHCFSA